MTDALVPSLDVAADRFAEYIEWFNRERPS